MTKAKAKVKTNVAETPKKSLLILAANELNEVMELDPIIKVTGKPKNDYLIKKIIEASSMIDKDDDISDRTMKVLKMLGVDIEEDVSDKGDKIQDKTPDETPDEVTEKKPEKKAAKKATSTVKKSNPITKKEKKYTRIQSVIDSIKKLSPKKTGFTLMELQTESDDIYCGKIGAVLFDNASNKMHPATHICNYMVTALVSFSILKEIEKGKYTNA